jgi:hypothetical protein
MGSTDQGSKDPVTLADGSGADAPLITLAILGASGSQDPRNLKVNHNCVNSTLMAAGIHAHAPNDVGAGLGTLLNQDAANHGAGDQVEVHRSGVVN